MPGMFSVAVEYSKSNSYCPSDWVEPTTSSETRSHMPLYLLTIALHRVLKSWLWESCTSTRVAISLLTPVLSCNDRGTLDQAPPVHLGPGHRGSRIFKKRSRGTGYMGSLLTSFPLYFCSPISSESGTASPRFTPPSPTFLLISLCR